MDINCLAPIAESLSYLVETRFYNRAMRREMPDVLEAIHQMGLKIGLISNVNSLGQVPTNLEKYGIKSYFDPIVLSSEYGRRKPDPSIFHYAARLINVPTSKCVYVGDRIARDILGAHRAGYGMAVQIRHNFRHGEHDEGAVPDAVIDQMTELPEIIRSVNSVSNPENLEGIRAIFFDAGDILYQRPERGCKLNAFLKQLSLNISDNHLIEKRELTDLAFTGKITQKQFREAILRLYGVSQPEQIIIGLQIMEEEDNDVHFFEGVASTITLLKEKGYLLGIITDTANPLHVKLGWFEKGGFGAAWDSVISSYELGIRKPDPGIYQAALMQLGVKPNQALFVGHKASELDGARSVGMKTVAFNFDPDANADYFIEAFSDLLTNPLIP